MEENGINWKKSKERREQELQRRIEEQENKNRKEREQETMRRGHIQARISES